MSRYLIASLRVLAETGTLLGGQVLADLQVARVLDRADETAGRKRGRR